MKPCSLFQLQYYLRRMEVSGNLGCTNEGHYHTTLKLLRLSKHIVAKHMSKANIRIQQTTRLTILDSILLEFIS